MLRKINITSSNIPGPIRRDDLLLLTIIGSVFYILLNHLVTRRIFAIFLSFIINLYLQKKSVSLLCSSISFSPLSNRIICYDLCYTTQSHSILSDVAILQLNWRLLFFSDLTTNSCINLTLRRLRYHLFHRHPTYEKLREIFEDRKRPLGKFANPRNEKYESSLFPLFYKISIVVQNGLLVFGNHTVPALLTFQFQSASGNYSLEPSSTPEDIYKLLFVARTRSMSIFIYPRANFDFISPFMHLIEHNNLFLQTDTFVIKYRSDEPGIANDLTLPPPEFSMSVWISSHSHLYYSPWCNQIRLLLQRLFFPWEYTTRHFGELPVRGKKRLFQNFIVKFLIGNESKTDSKLSNIFIHFGFIDPNANNMQCSLLNLTCSIESNITIDYPWRESEDGHSPEIFGILSKLHVFSPTFSLPEFAEIDNLEFSIFMHFPRRWNGLQKWRYFFKVDHARINFVYSHLNFFNSLLDDWNSLPEQPPDIQSFIPIDLKIDVQFNCFQIYTFLNQFNWVNTPICSKNNTQLAIVGKRGRINLCFPFIEYHPLRQSISITVLGEDITGRLYIPQSLSNHNSVFCLSDSVSKWVRPILFEAHNLCTLCIEESRIGNAFENDWLTLGSGPYLLIESTFSYTPETHREQVKLEIPNNLSIFVDITDLLARLYGSLITVLLSLKDNYPGEYQNHQPFTEKGPGIPYGGIPMPGKLKSGSLEVELVFNLKQALLELPKYPNPWENDCPLLPAIYLHLIEISFHRTLYNSAVRVITGSIFVTSPSKQKDQEEIEMGFGLTEKFEFYGHSMTGETFGEWQEYAWLVEAKLGVINGNCSLSQLLEVANWLQIAVYHIVSQEDNYSYPVYQYCPGEKNFGNGIPGCKLKYQFIVFNIGKINLTLFQECDVALIVSIPGIQFELCNLYTCTSSHGLTLIIPSMSLSVLVPSFLPSDWIEVGHIKTGQITFQGELKQVIDLNFEKQLEFLIEGDVTKNLWFLYPDSAKKDEKGRIICGCKGGCFFFGRCEMSHKINWLPHLIMARECRHTALSDYLDFLTPIGDDPHSFSNLNSLFVFILQFYSQNNSNRSPEKNFSDSTSPKLDRFLSVNTNSAESYELKSETLSFRSAFSNFSIFSDNNSQVSEDSSAEACILPVSGTDKKTDNEGILSLFNLNVKMLHSQSSFHLFQMFYNIRKINPSYFPDANDALYQAPINVLTLDTFSTNSLTIYPLVFTLRNFSECRTSRLTCFQTNYISSTKGYSTPNDIDMSQVKIQVNLNDDVHISALTSIFKTIKTLLESIQEMLVTPHPLHVLDKIKNNCLRHEAIRADLVNFSTKISNSFSFSIFSTPTTSIYFTLVRNSPIYHHIDTHINSDKKYGCTFYSFVSLVLSPSFIHVLFSTSSTSRKHITSTHPDSSRLTTECVQIGFHLSMMYLFFRSGLLYCLQPGYTFENIYQAFEHIPHMQTKFRIERPLDEDQFIQLSQFEVGLDDIIVIGCLNNKNEKNIKLIDHWWSILGHTNNFNGNMDLRCSAFWFNLPCPRDIDLIKKHIAPSWITTLILFIDEVHKEVLHIVSFSKLLIDLRSSWFQDTFISLAAPCLSSSVQYPAHRTETNLLFDEKSEFLHSTLILEYLNCIQSIFLIERQSNCFKHFSNTLTKKYKQNILDSLFAHYIFSQISRYLYNSSLELNWDGFLKYFNSTNQRYTLYTLFGCFDILFSQLDFIPNSYKSELTSFNFYLQIRDIFILISPPQYQSRVIFDSPPLLSIQPFRSTIKIMNNSPLCRIPRYHLDVNETPQYRLKLQIRSTIRMSKLSLYFEAQDMILIYSSILGLNIHLSTMRDGLPSSHREAHQKFLSNDPFRQEWTDNWVHLNDQSIEMLQSKPSVSIGALPNVRNGSKEKSFLSSSMTSNKRYQPIDTSDVESISSGSNCFTQSDSADSFLSDGESHFNLLFILHIDDTIIFSPDEVNFNLSFNSFTFSALLKENFHLSYSNPSLQRDFTSIITIGVNGGKLQITDADTHADLLYSFLSPVNGLAMITLKNGYKKHGVLPSLEHLHYLFHLNLTDLNLSILRPPDLLFDSISKISLKLVRDISTLINSYNSIDLEKSKYNPNKHDSLAHSPLFFHDPSLPFNLPSGSILLDFHSAVLNIEALESISLQYEFNGFTISLDTAPQSMRLSVIIDLHVIVALSKITGKPYDTLNIPKIMIFFEVKSLKPITFIPELSIQSINLHFSVDLINQITALVVAYMYEIRNLYYELKPYLPKTSYENSTLLPQSEIKSLPLREATFSILDLLHSVKIHFDPINISLTSSPGLSMRLTTTILDINIKNPNAFNYRRNLNKIQSGKFILMEKIQVDVSLSLTIALTTRQEHFYEIAYFRTSILAEDSISSDAHKNIGDFSNFVEYSDSKHLFLLTIVNPHLFIPTFAMENIFTYIIHWHGGYLFWQKQVRHHDYTTGNITPTLHLKNYQDRINQTPAFFDFFSSTIFMITVIDLGICIPVTYQAKLASNIPFNALLCTVASASVSALFGKKSGAVGTFKDFRIGFQSNFNPNRKLWSISHVSTARVLNSGCVEQGTCKLCLTFSLDDFLFQAKRDRIQVRLVFDIAGYDSHLDSGIGYYVSALIKSITNLAFGIEAIQESTSYETQGLRQSYIPEDSPVKSRLPPRRNSGNKYGNKQEYSEQKYREKTNLSLSDKEFSSLVSDTIRNTSSLFSSMSSEKNSLDDEIIHRKQDDFVGFLQAIDLDVNISVKIAHGNLQIDSIERGQTTGESKISSRFFPYPCFSSPGLSNDFSSDETSGTEYSQPCFTESSTLFIPGLDISISFVSSTSILGENKYINGSTLGESSAMTSAMLSPSCAKFQPARLHALVLIKSIPKEMRILPALLEFLDKIAQPISNFAHSTSFLLGSSAPTEHSQNIFASYTQSDQFFPIDVLISMQLQPLIVKLTCFPISRVEAILQTPQIEAMCSFTIYKHQERDFESSYSYKLLRSYLNKIDLLSLYFLTDFNLTFYLSKLSLSISSYLVTKHDEFDEARTRDALRIQLDRAKFNLFRRETNYSLDIDNTSLPASTVDLSLVAVIGKLFFKYDMRRLTDVTTFRKCWYRQGLMNLLFLGANLANAQPSEPKGTKIKAINDIESASIILFCLQILESEVKCNLADIMGDCNLNTKSLGINGQIGHQGQKLLLLTVHKFVEDAKFLAHGGVIAGHNELDNANFYIKLSDCQILPSHELSFDVNSFDGRLKYMGLTVLTFETCKIKTQGKDSWKETFGNLTLRLLVDIEWKMFRIMLTRSSFDSILNITYRLQTFIEEQRQRSSKLLTRLLPLDGHPALVSFMTKIDNEKQIEPPIKRLFSISWLWAVEKGVFKLIKHLGFSLSAQSDLHLGGNVNISGGGFAIAFSPGDNFLIDTWTVIAIKELLVNFNTDAIPGLILEQQECIKASFAHRICKQSFHIELGCGKNKYELDEKAGVYKVIRTKGPAPLTDSPNSEWLDYACIESKLGITKKIKDIQSTKYKIKISPIPILSFPSFFIHLITNHFCSFNDETQDFQGRVECNLDSNFYGEVAVTTNVDLYLYLHDLFKCYIERLKSLADKQSERIEKQENRQRYVDSRIFNCDTWHLEPMLNVMSMVSWGSGSVNPHIDWLLDKLSLNKARTTIPKCIQRGAMDPIDHLISLFLRRLLLFSAGKKSFSDFQ